jgi:hypothetical protein
MYKYTLIRISDNKEVARAIVHEPIEPESVEGCYIDVCRIVDDPLSDTANFRDEVDYELEEL